MGLVAAVGQVRKRTAQDADLVKSKAALIAELLRKRPDGGRKAKARRTSDRAIECLTLSAVSAMALSLQHRWLGDSSYIFFNIVWNHLFLGKV